MNDKYKKLLPLIEENRDLIDGNRFEELYKKFLFNQRSELEYFGLLTDLLYRAGLNPLLHMNSIPSFFMYRNQISELNIPSNIKLIDTFGLARSAILEITIPSTVKEINYNAFVECFNLESVIFQESSELCRIPDNCFFSCRNLKQITLPISIREISVTAFTYCENLHNIIYNGPYKMFKRIEDYLKSSLSSNLIHVRCTDKEFNLGE